jgi:subtilase family serine protease
VNRRSCLPLLAIALYVTLGSVPSHGETVLTRHVREVTRTGEAKPVGVVPGNQIMQLDLVLTLRDPAGLENFLANLYSSATPNHVHYLTPEEFTEKFGPTVQDYEAVVRYAQSHGLAVVGGSRDGMEVQVRGPVMAIEAAFHLNLLTYQHPTENRIFYAPDREPTTDLSFALWHISGLDNYSIPHPKYVNKNDYARAHGMNPEAVIGHTTTGSGPQQSFLGSDMRAAYYGGTALTGNGQTLGLFEYVGTDLADLDTYYKNVKQTNKVPITLLSTDGTSTKCSYTAAGDYCDDTEQTLDMTQSLGIAPGLSSLVMYIGSTDTAIISSMTTHKPLPSVISCSWGWTPSDASTLDPYFKKMAAQGQNFLVASGDDSTWTKTGDAEAWPADDDYIVSVGGTDLITTKAGGAWKSETAWNSSGGGFSPDDVEIPSYQKLAGVINSSNKGSTKLRNGPDVSANANFTFYVCADQSGCVANLWGGTSFSAPAWAGYIALVNEQLKTDGYSNLGFINPYLYAFGVSSHYDTDFHDITKGSSGKYSAVKGFDLVTGWGSPNGEGLINALVGEK